MLSIGHFAIIRYLLPYLIWLAFVNCAISQALESNFHKADRLFTQRDLAGAREEFLLLEKTEATRLLARYYLGRIALLGSNPMEAISWLESVVASNPPVLDSLEQLGKAYFDSGQFEKAKTFTERAIQVAPWNGALHYRLGRIYQNLGDLEASGREFTESIRLKTADRESVEMLLRCSELLKQGETTRAAAIGRDALQDLSLDPDVLVALGLTFAGAGMPNDSVALFRRAAERDPNFLQAQFNTGLALLKMLQPVNATPFLMKARQLAPDAVEVNAALALAYFAGSRFGEAVLPLENWLKLDPRNPRALNMLGLCFLRTGSAAKAVSPLRNSIFYSHEDPKPYFILIEALNASEQQNEALQVAEEGVQKFPLVARMNLAKAQQLARLGRYREAGPGFTRASELAPEQTEPLLGLAETQQKQGAYAISLETYRRALAIDKGDLTACLGAARNLVLLRRLAEARELLENLVAAHPGDPRLHYELLGVYARLGERQLAQEQTQILEKLKSNAAEAR